MEALPLAGAGQHVDPHRVHPLDPGELLAVEAELEDVGGLGVSELGVDRLVGAVGLPLEKVGLPAPAPAGERALIDDVDARADGGFGLSGGAIPVEVGLERDLEDGLSPRREGERGKRPHARAPYETQAQPDRYRTAA